MVKSQMPRIQNNFASRFTLHASRFIFRRAACNLWRAAICTILFLFTLWVSCFAQDKIVAIVNKDIITQKDLNDFINFTRVQLSTDYKGRQLESKIQSIKLDLLDKLIEDRLILQEAKRLNISINPEMIKARINEIKKHYGSDNEFQNAIAKQGLVQADIEARIRDQSLMFAAIDAKIRSKIIVKPFEVTEFYQENIQKLILPEQREFESITIDEASLANEVFDKLKKGKELKDVADSYSLTVNKFTSTNEGQLRKDIEEIVFKMNIGEISAPVRIENNYYIFKLNNIIPRRQQSLYEIQDEISSMLFNKKMEEELTKWLDDLKKHSYIRILQN